ncbi:hypothetical protein SAY87_031617 [Trapa incisa]|uniref:Uncharacterized protein n=1 Tax=Trapa incisa TaxID=236973 RepID=A0AAN7KWC6_9MYRT|nr:hypothetical protein SAY87_031617 [Trapa incisa]
MGKQYELKEALEQKEQTEERLKVMRKDVDLLRGSASRAEVVIKAVKKKLYECNDKLHELQEQFKAADAVRQEAYQELKVLREQLRDKNKYFYKYKNDATISNEMGSKGDRDGVSGFCLKQVEEFMELWSNDVEFRSEYIRCSSKGTLRRIGTKDGRSLGVDELPPATTTYPSETVPKEKPGPAFPSLVQAKTQAEHVEVVPPTEKVSAIPVEQKKRKPKAKAPAKAAEAPVLATTVFVSDFEVAEIMEGEKQTEEEEEKARKEEELRKEKEAARMKEQHRLEEKAKAEAVRERKKRKAERAQARAAARAQKEAEQKEKEREKRLRKKERKRAAGSTPADIDTKGESDPYSPAPVETPQEPETMEKVEVAAKRGQRQTRLTKQTKSKSTIPPPLRKRGKKKMQPWLWVMLMAVLVLALFLAGNYFEHALLKLYQSTMMGLSL